jgi:DNA polymerase-3 subunit gamma/tau
VRTPLGDRWAATVAGLIERQAITALVRELAMQSELVAIEGSRWLLRVERESLRAAPLRDKLEAALAAALGEPVRLETEAGTAQDSPARREAAERERRQREAEQIIHGDPLVQELMGQFRTARIVPGSIKPH